MAAGSDMSCQRAPWLDALRGVAMLWMTVFHFCFDLVYFGWSQQNFYQDPFWTWQRTGIVSLFLFTAGVGQALAVQQAQGWGRFFQRWWRVAACALLVSVASWWMFPRSWIYFGVLHGLAVMLVLARCLALRRVRVAGLVALGAGLVALHALMVLWGPALGWPELFNSKALSWLGLNWRKPITEDFVPLLPWMGVVCWGLAFGQWWGTAPGSQPMQRLWNAPRSSGWRALAWLGQRSLAYYMLHQPLLWGLMWSARQLA